MLTIHKGIFLGLILGAASASAQTAVTTTGGTTNAVPVFTGSATVGSSVITQSGSSIGIGTTSPITTLDVHGTTHIMSGTAGSSNAIVIGPEPLSLSTEYAVQDQPAIIINGYAGGSAPNFNGNSIGIYDFRNYAGSYTSGFPPPSIYFGKSRSGTAGTLGAIVQSGDLMGALSFVGDNGTNFATQGAYIGGEVDGTPSSTSVPGRLTFATTAVGSASPVERLRIASTGFVGIGTTAPAYKLDVSGGQINASGGFCIAGNCITAWPTVGTGTGTVTSITAGAGLSGGTITGTGTIGLNLANANSWTAQQIFGGGATFPGSGIWNSSGNVGIGTTAPVDKLSINSGTVNMDNFGFVSSYRGSGNGYTNLFLGGSIKDDGNGSYTVTTDGGSNYFAAIRMDNTGSNAGAINFYSRPTISGSSYTLTNTQLASYVQMSLVGGSLGIGTTAPGAKLEVNGNVKLTSGSGASITFADGTVQSTAYTGVTCGGDYAETVDVAGNKSAYEPGDIMVLSKEAGADVVKSSEPYSTMVAGIYSTKPGVVGRRQTTDPKTSTTEIPMAMVGIVPTKVSAENGPIQRGDLLVSSTLVGYAMKGTDRARMLGAVLGKAMGNLESGTGVIEVLVTLQ